MLSYRPFVWSKNCLTYSVRRYAKRLVSSVSLIRDAVDLEQPNDQYSPTDTVKEEYM